MIGIIGRAQRRHEMQIHALAALSNHYHALVTPRSADHLADFMSLVNGKIAKEAARLHDWPQRVWSRPYEPIVVTNEERAQVGRLVYLLAHGAKEGFVADPRDWPGMHCARALIDGAPIKGLWFDRTREYAARRRRKSFSASDFATVETITFSPLPCWSHLAAEDYRVRVRELVETIIRDARLGRNQDTCLYDPSRLDPHLRPCRTKRSPAPRVHAATEEARQEFLEAYRLFLASRSTTTKKTRLL